MSTVSIFLGHAGNTLMPLARSRSHSRSCPHLYKRSNPANHNNHDKFLSPSVRNSVSLGSSISTLNDASSKYDSDPFGLDIVNETTQLLTLEAFGGSLKTLTAVSTNNKSFKRRNRAKLAKKSRLVHKSGNVNVCSWNVPKRDRQFLRDIFTTLIDVKWRLILLTFIITFYISWIIFAILYYILAAIHGDFADWSPSSLLGESTAASLQMHGAAGGQLPDSFRPVANVSSDASEHVPCFRNVDSFPAAFLFSVETQHTIGFGYRFITTECSVAVCVMCVQCICGLLLQSFMVGLVFAKLARPKKRAETLIFSENAVISLRDGSLCLLFRVGDMRNTHLVEAHIRMQLIRQRVTAEGEVEPLYQSEMSIGENNNDDRLFLVWPTTVCHKIGPDSPLYEVTAQSLPTEQFEIIVILEGIVESTGMTVQARTSYLPKEICWGHRYEKLVTYQSDNGSYRIDYSLIHSTYAADSPMCSAKELERIKKCGQQKTYFCKTDAEAAIEENKFLECSPMPSPFGGSFRNRLPSGFEERLAKHRSSDVSMKSNGSRKSNISDQSESMDQGIAINPPSINATTTVQSSNRFRPIGLSVVSPPKIVVESPTSPINNSPIKNHIQNHSSHQDTDESDTSQSDIPVTYQSQTNSVRMPLSLNLANHRNSSFIAEKPTLTEVLEESNSELNSPMTSPLREYQEFNISVTHHV